jgi:predicted NUDIX family NTP pyrophosphohydrolase
VPEQYLPEGQAVHDVWPARAWYWPAGHAAQEDDSSEKKEPAGHEAGVAVDAGAVVRGEECGAAADVVVADVVEAGEIEAAAVVAATVVAGEGCVPDTTDEVGET